MLAVLSVQLFGLVRPGNRISSSAKFESFFHAAQTVFQVWYNADDDASSYYVEAVDKAGAVLLSA